MTLNASLNVHAFSYHLKVRYKHVANGTFVSDCKLYECRRKEHKWRVFERTGNLSALYMICMLIRPSIISS